MAEILLKGIKQVFAETYNNTAVDDKKGYLWFVRDDSGSTGGDIYIGTRHYSHFNESDSEEIAKIAQLVTEVNKHEESLTAISQSLAALIEKNTAMEASIKGLRESLEEVAAKELFAGKDIAINEQKQIDIATNEDIVIAGLNDSYGCGLLKNGETIPAGSSLSDILKKMLSKEINPAAATKPSISITKVSAVSGLKEVNEQVSVVMAEINKKNGTFNNNGWTNPAQPTASFEWSNEKMSAVKTMGAADYVAQENVIKVLSSTATTSQGVNRVKITATADYTAPTNKPKTNLSKDYVGAEATWTDGQASAETTIEWVGVYPCYANVKSLGTEPNEKLALFSGDTIEFTVGSHNDEDFRFAYPDGWTISKLEVMSLSGQYEPVAAEYKKNAGDLTKTVQGQTVTYHYLSINNGDAKYKITLDKKLGY